MKNEIKNNQNIVQKSENQEKTFVYDDVVITVKKGNTNDPQKEQKNQPKKEMYIPGSEIDLSTYNVDMNRKWSFGLQAASDIPRKTKTTRTKKTKTNTEENKDAVQLVKKETVKDEKSVDATRNTKEVVQETKESVKSKTLSHKVQEKEVVDVKKHEDIDKNSIEIKNTEEKVSAVEEKTIEKEKVDSQQEGTEQTIRTLFEEAQKRKNQKDANDSAYAKSMMTVYQKARRQKLQEDLVMAKKKIKNVFSNIGKVTVGSINRFKNYYKGFQESEKQYSNLYREVQQYLYDNVSYLQETKEFSQSRYEKLSKQMTDQILVDTANALDSNTMSTKQTIKMIMNDPTFKQDFFEGCRIETEVYNKNFNEAKQAIHDEWKALCIKEGTRLANAEFWESISDLKRDQMAENLLVHTLTTKDVKVSKDEEYFNQEEKLIDMYHVYKEELMLQAIRLYSDRMDQERERAKKELKEQIRLEKDRQQQLQKVAQHDARYILDEVKEEIEKVVNDCHIPQQDQDAYQKSLFQDVINHVTHQTTYNKKSQKVLLAKASFDAVELEQSMLQYVHELQDGLEQEVEYIREICDDKFEDCVKAWIKASNGKIANKEDVIKLINKKENLDHQYWGLSNLYLDELEVMAKSKETLAKNVLSNKVAQSIYENTDEYTKLYYRIFNDDLLDEAQRKTLEIGSYVQDRVVDAVKNQVEFLQELPTTDMQNKFANYLASNVILQTMNVDELDNHVLDNMAQKVTKNEKAFLVALDRKTQEIINNFNTEVADRKQKANQKLQGIIEKDFDNDEEYFKGYMAALKDEYQQKGFNLDNENVDPNNFSVNYAEKYLQQMQAMKQADEDMVRKLYDDLHIENQVTFAEYLEAKKIYPNLDQLLKENPNYLQEEQELQALLAKEEKQNKKDLKKAEKAHNALVDKIEKVDNYNRAYVLRYFDITEEQLDQMQKNNKNYIEDMVDYVRSLNKRDVKEYLAYFETLPLNLTTLMYENPNYLKDEVVIAKNLLTINARKVRENQILQQTEKQIHHNYEKELLTFAKYCEIPKNLNAILEVNPNYLTEQIELAKQRIAQEKLDKKAEKLRQKQEKIARKNQVKEDEKNRIQQNQADFEHVIESMASDQTNYKYLKDFAFIRRRDAKVTQPNGLKKAGAFLARNWYKFFSVAMAGYLVGSVAFSIAAGTSFVGFVTGAAIVYGGVALANAIGLGKLPILKDVIRNRRLAYGLSRREVERATLATDRMMNGQKYGLGFALKKIFSLGFYHRNGDIVDRLDEANRLLNHLQSMNLPNKRRVNKTYDRIMKLLEANGKQPGFVNEDTKTGIDRVYYATGLAKKLAKRLGVNKSTEFVERNDRDFVKLFLNHSAEELHYDSSVKYGRGKRFLGIFGGPRSVGYAIKRLENHDADKYYNKMTNIWKVVDEKGNVHYQVCRKQKQVDALLSRYPEAEQMSVLENYKDDFNNLVDESRSMVESIQTILAKADVAYNRNMLRLRKDISREEVKELRNAYKENLKEMARERVLINKEDAMNYARQNYDLIKDRNRDGYTAREEEQEVSAMHTESVAGTQYTNGDPDMKKKAVEITEQDIQSLRQIEGGTEINRYNKEQIDKMSMDKFRKVCHKSIKENEAYIQDAQTKQAKARKMLAILNAQKEDIQVELSNLESKKSSGLEEGNEEEKINYYQGKLNKVAQFLKQIKDRQMILAAYIEEKQGFIKSLKTADDNNELEQ